MVHVGPDHLDNSLALVIVSVVTQVCREERNFGHGLLYGNQVFVVKQNWIYHQGFFELCTPGIVACSITLYALYDAPFVIITADN